MMNAIPRRLLIAIGAGLACHFTLASVLPDVAVPPVAALVGLLVHRWYPYLFASETDLAREKELLAMPLALDVLSLALDVGVSWDRCVALAADCCEGRLATDLRLAARRLAMGAAAHEVWVGSDALLGIGAVVERSHRSGAAVSVLLRQSADTRRAAERVRRIERSKRLGTRILMPVTFLGYPAFFVLAVIPSMVVTARGIDFGFSSTG